MSLIHKLRCPTTQVIQATNLTSLVPFSFVFRGFVEYLRASDIILRSIFKRKTQTVNSKNFDQSTVVQTV